MNTDRGTASIRTVVIGCGRMGIGHTRGQDAEMPPGLLPISHAAAISSLPELELRAVCDIDEERLAMAKELYPAVKAYTSPERMLEAEAPALLSIATRTAGRPELMIRAASHGVRAIHLEKPIARNMADCRLALEHLRRREVALSYGTTRRYMDVYRKARELLDAGSIGSLKHIAIEHGADMLLWGHPHSVDLLLFFARCTAVEYVQGNLQIDSADFSGLVLDADPIVDSATIRFENGVLGQITQGGGLNVRLTGSEGLLAITGDGGNLELRRRPQNSSYFTEVVYPNIEVSLSGTQRALSELAAALTSRAELSISSEEISVNLNILLAMARSSLRGGERLPLEAVEDDFTVTGRFGNLYA